MDSPLQTLEERVLIDQNVISRLPLTFSKHDIQQSLLELD